MTDALLTVERVAVTAAVVLTGTLFLPSLADPVNVVKLTALLLCALAAVAAAAVRICDERIVRLPTNPAAWAGAALLLALVITTITAPTTTTAVVGTYGRNSGLLAYVAAIALFLLGARAWTATTVPILLIGATLAGLATASYGLLQYEHVDPIHWNNPFNPIIGSLGNPDFAAAFLGICVPAAVWGCLWNRWALPWRVASGLVGALCFLAALLSSAIQGPAAAAVGLLVLAAAWSLEREPKIARAGLAGVATVAVVGAATVAAGAAKVG